MKPTPALILHGCLRGATNHGSLRPQPSSPPPLSSAHEGWQRPQAAAGSIFSFTAVEGFAGPGSWSPQAGVLWCWQSSRWRKCAAAARSSLAVLLRRRRALGAS